MPSPALELRQLPAPALLLHAGHSQGKAKPWVGSSWVFLRLGLSWSWAPSQVCKTGGLSWTNGSGGIRQDSGRKDSAPVIFVPSPGCSLATILCPQGEGAGGLLRSEPVGGGQRLRVGSGRAGGRLQGRAFSLGRWLDPQQ